MERVAAGLSEHVHERAVVLRGWYLDLSHPHFLRPAALHHHHWNPLGKDALPHGKAGPVTIRHGGRIAHEQRRVAWHAGGWTFAAISTIAFTLSAVP